MYSKSNLFLIIIVAIILAQTGWAEEWLYVGQYDQCEGKDSANYTNIIQQSSDGQCSQSSVKWNTYVYILNGPRGEKAVNNVQVLATSRYPAGAEVIVETLGLFTSGPLAGKFNYYRSKHLVRGYHKKCSSVLGLSFMTLKNVQLLISDRLDPYIFFSPTGAYEAFKKGATTICTGNYYGA